VSNARGEKMSANKLWFPKQSDLIYLFVIVGSCFFISSGVFARDRLVKTDPALEKWKAVLWQSAKEQGIRAKTFKAALGNVRPNYKLPRVRTHTTWDKIIRQQKKSGMAQKRKAVSKNSFPASCSRPRQKEFLFPTGYFQERYVRNLVAQGKEIRNKYKRILPQIEQRYGVDMRAVLGIWGKETAYGRAKNKFDGIRTLFSLAYAGAPDTRKKHRQNLLHALKFIDEGHIDLAAYKTTYAGATGYPQFSPDIVAKYAVDFDGDGRKNIWSSVPDALASAANYLKAIGWKSGQGWGYEVTVPDGFNCATEGPSGRKTIAQWHALGVRRVKGADGKVLEFPDPSQKVQFMAPAGLIGPKFLVTENFEVFRRYNKADLYALFVGHLGDLIWCNGSRKKCEFQTAWPGKDNFGFTRKRICEIQIHLKHLGASEENPDGLFGGKTRNGIGTFERQMGRAPRCFPSKALLKSLRDADK